MKAKPVMRFSVSTYPQSMWFPDFIVSVVRTDFTGRARHYINPSGPSKRRALRVLTAALTPPASDPGAAGEPDHGQPALELPAAVTSRRG